jgi:hypothetical protein
MAINFVQGQLSTQNDPNPGGPSATSNDKDVHVKVVRLSAVNFTTAGVNTLGAVFPADSTILSVDVYVKAVLNNGATLPVVSLGSTSGGTDFASAVAVTNTAGYSARLTPVTAIMQNYSLPLGSDIQVWVRGACSTANPTTADVYVIFNYVR